MTKTNTLAVLLLCGSAAILGCNKAENSPSDTPAGAPNTSLTNTPINKEQSVHAIRADDSRIQVMGRSQTLSDGSLHFAYPGVALSFVVNGRAAKLMVASSSAQSHLEIIVDGGEPRRVKLAPKLQPIVLFESETRMNRHVQIVHRGETWHGQITVQGLSITDGDLGQAPALPTKRLLFLGDSVTCGEAIERPGTCTKDSSWSNPRESYGMLTAKALDAQVQLVCYGGRGLVRSWNGKTDEHNLPDFFELSIADASNPVTWDHSRYTPDMIVSAIGTNDFSEGIPERENYVATYVSFVQRLLELHPQAQVALTEGAILNGEKKVALSEYLAETARRVNSPRLHLVPSNHYPGDTCDAHPTKEQHAAMAADLTPLLRNITGW
jgi:lysophospholipase L1-like esterase